MEFLKYLTPRALFPVLITGLLFCQGCMGTSGFIIEGVEVDQELVENLSREDALIMMKTLIRAHAPSGVPGAMDKDSTCKITDEGVSGNSGGLVPFDQLSLSYSLRSLDALNYGPQAVFSHKANGSEVCYYLMDITLSPGRSQRVFDWQQKLLTPSVIVLGGELAQAE